MMNVLTAHQLSIGYEQGRRRKVIGEHLELEINAGEIVTLLGPNGAGKSTLIRTLAGLLPPLAGTLLIGGESIGGIDRSTLAKRVSVVLTERVTPYMMTCRELVALGRFPHTNWFSQFSPADHEAVERALDAVGASHLADRFTSEISDGERQKVLIARGLAQEPMLLILDEPTAFLDLPHRIELMLLLNRIARERQCAVLLSTHDLELVLRYTSQFWLMWGNGQFAAGSAEELLDQGLFTRAFGSLFNEFHYRNSLNSAYIGAENPSIPRQNTTASQVPPAEVC